MVAGGRGGMSWANLALREQRIELLVVFEQEMLAPAGQARQPGLSHCRSLARRKKGCQVILPAGSRTALLIRPTHAKRSRWFKPDG